MVRRLVASGGKINQRSKGGYTLLMLAAMLYREEAYAVLLEIPGCNPDLRDYSGKKARDYLPKRDDLEKSEGYWGSESGYDGEEDDANGGGKRKRMMQKVDRVSSFLRGFVRSSSRNVQEKFERDQYQVMAPPDRRNFTCIFEVCSFESCFSLSYYLPTCNPTRRLTWVSSPSPSRPPT